MPSAVPADFEGMRPVFRDFGSLRSADSPRRNIKASTTLPFVLDSCRRHSSRGTGWAAGIPSSARNGRRTMAPSPPRVGA